MSEDKPTLYGLKNLLSSNLIISVYVNTLILRVENLSGRRQHKGIEKFTDFDVGYKSGYSSGYINCKHEILGEKKEEKDE